MCVLFSSWKTKLTTLHNLLINLSWGSVVYKVLKSYVAIDVFIALILYMFYETREKSINIMLTENI